MLQLISLTIHHWLWTIIIDRNLRHGLNFPDFPIAFQLISFPLVEINEAWDYLQYIFSDSKPIICGKHYFTSHLKHSSLVLVNSRVLCFPMIETQRALQKKVWLPWKLGISVKDTLNKVFLPAFFQLNLSKCALHGQQIFQPCLKVSCNLQWHC